MESTGIDYQLDRHCELKQIGGLLDSKAYGIAMPVSKLPFVIWRSYLGFAHNNMGVTY